MLAHGAMPTGAGDSGARMRKGMREEYNGPGLTDCEDGEIGGMSYHPCKA